MLLLFCWTQGAAGLPTNTSDADIRGCRAVKTAAPPRGFIPSGLTQPSIGDLPHCIARVPAGIALPLFGSVVCQSHRKTIESSGPASRPAQLHPRLNPYRQPTASQPAFHLVTVSHPPFTCLASWCGLAVADLNLVRPMRLRYLVKSLAVGGQHKLSGVMSL